MKKRLLMAVLMLCMVFAFGACGDNNTNNNDDENVNNEQDANNNNENENEDDGSQEAEDGKITYTVIVTDEEGNPIAGAMVQVCDEGNCYAPTTTNEEGVAEFKLAEASGYKAKLLTNPEGYEAVDADYVYYEEGKTELTLTVKPVE